MLPIIALVFLFAPSFGHPDEYHEIAHSKYFKLLLHYRESAWAPARSEADGPEFFLSPKGKFDLDAELSASLIAFADEKAKGVGPLKQHPQCAFPERFRFIKEQTHLHFHEQDCSEYKAWRDKLRARSVTLVYAAPFLGSPSSMFGHSFLRIDHRDNTLLDYGISFEALTGPDPGFLYALKGLTGVYPGYFSQMPYFLKVNTYSNVDSRDLWEYELNLNEEQISHMLDHLWELGTTYFDYYFFNKNCSYQLLSLIEVANPLLELRKQFGAMSIPIDTIRVLNQYPGLIRTRTFRPSLLKNLRASIAQFKPEERKRFFELRNDLSSLNDKEEPRLLDALLDLQMYESLNSSITLKDTNQKIDSKLLLARAKSTLPIGVRTPTVSQADSELKLNLNQGAPEFGHKSSKLGFGFGQYNDKNLIGFEFRPAIHDLLDSDQGYVRNSSLIIAQTRLSYLNDEKLLRLEEFKLAEVTNFSPFTRLEKNISWLIGSKIFHPNDLDCLNCENAQFYAGAGLSFSILRDRVLLYTLAKAYLEAKRFAPVFEMGAIGSFGSKFKGLVSFERRWYFPHDIRSDLNVFKFEASQEFTDFQILIELQSLNFTDQISPQTSQGNFQTNIQTNSLLSLAHYY